MIRAKGMVEAPLETSAIAPKPIRKTRISPCIRLNSRKAHAIAIIETIAMLSLIHI